MVARLSGVISALCLYRSLALNVYPLVEIEWAEFRRSVERKRPNNVPAEWMLQDIDATRAVIESTGKRFPLEVSEKAVRVIGHVK